MIFSKKISLRSLNKLTMRNILENKLRSLVIVLTEMIITALILLIIVMISNMTEEMKRDGNTLFLYDVVISIVLVIGCVVLFNIMQVSVRFDIKLYERMRTMGSSSAQIKYVVFYQIIVTGIVGILVGLILGCRFGKHLIVNVLSSYFSKMTISLNHKSVLFTVLLMLATIFIAGIIPAKIASKVPTTETLKEGDRFVSTYKVKKRWSRLPFLYQLSFISLRHNKAESVISIGFMALGLIILSCAYVINEKSDNAIDKVLILVSIIIFVIGLLNLINTMITATTFRRKEFGIMQSLGMTKKQLRTLLLFEGMNHAVITLIISYILSCVMISTVVKNYLEGQWSSPHSLVLNPFLLFTPVILIITLGIPLLGYLWVVKEPPIKRME
ncbi:MAG: FtsX-like permease family protein [Lachnospiraceae bacterium]